jgi:hypothetical protein
LSRVRHRKVIAEIKKEEGRRKKEEGRRKKEETIIAMVSVIKNFLTVGTVLITLGKSRLLFWSQSLIVKVHRQYLPQIT